MFLGNAISLTANLLSTIPPVALFAASEQGAWYDPSDLTTLFQDSAGATPVTTPGQTVGKILDKSGRGNHATQATLAQRPTYGISPITEKRNLLTFTEQFDNAAWTLTSATVTANADTAPDGTITAEKLIASATAATHSVGQNLIVSTATTYTGSVYVKAGEYNFASLLLLTTFAATQVLICDLTLGTITSTSGSPLATSITAVGSGWYRISITQITNAAGTATIQVRPSDSGTTTFFTGDGISGIYAWGAQLEVASASTAYQKVVSQYEVTTGTRNLLTYTEEFDNAAWTLTNATVTANAGTAPDGALTAEKLIASATLATHTAGQNLTVPTATTYTGSVYVKAGEYNFAALLLLTTFAAAQFIICDLTLGTIITTSGSPLATSITDVGNGWYRISITQITNAAGTATIQIRPSNSGITTSFTGDGTSGIYAWGAQLEQSFALTAYQKVVSQYEVTEAGVASASYISFDGVDDGMVTGTITPGIDKVQVFAGIRRISDASTGILAEFSQGLGVQAGRWYMVSPAGSGVAGSGFASKGTLSALNNTVSPAAPITEVLTGIGDIAGDVNTFRKNGVATSELTDQGTGNFLPYVLYIGRRNGASLAVNSRIYSLIVRFGDNLTAGQITATESYVNGKTGAY